MQWTRMALLTRAREADGEVVWSRRLDAGVKLVEMAMSALRAQHAEIH